MKITFNIDDEKIPDTFKGKPDVIFAFLHENLYVQNFAKAENNVANREYRKAFYNNLKLNGDLWVEGIEREDDERIRFARLILDSIQLEEKVRRTVAQWENNTGTLVMELYESDGHYTFDGEEMGDLPKVSDDIQAIDWMEKFSIKELRKKKKVTIKRVTQCLNTEL